MSITAPGHYCPGGCSSPFGEPTGGICPAGTYCPPSSMIPIPCEPGTYSADAGRSVPCDPCPIGRFAPQAGSASLADCRWCDANLTTLRAGTSSRANCVARSYACPAGTVAYRLPPLSRADCEVIQCPVGMRLSVDSTSCEGECRCNQIHALLRKRQSSLLCTMHRAARLDARHMRHHPIRLNALLQRLSYRRACITCAALSPALLSSAIL